jgi:hypothetical protein
MGREGSGLGAQYLCSFRLAQAVIVEGGGLSVGYLAPYDLLHMRLGQRAPFHLGRAIAVLHGGGEGFAKPLT